MRIFPIFILQKKSLRAFIISLCAPISLVLIGCATSPLSDTSDAVLMLQTISVRKPFPSSGNYEIKAFIQQKGVRYGIKAYATDCQDNAGNIFPEDDFPMVKVVINGPTKADQIFTEMCKIGLPIADSLFRAGH